MRFPDLRPQAPATRLQVKSTCGTSSVLAAAFDSTPIPDMIRMRTTTSYQELQTCQRALVALARARLLTLRPHLLPPVAAAMSC